MRNKFRMWLKIYSEPDVHVNWHMTPDEWDQLWSALSAANWNNFPYLRKLHEEGKI